MANLMGERERRHWADVVAIVAGVWAAGQALWGTTLFGPGVQDSGLGWNWFVYGFGGAIAVAGVILAQRARDAGRILVGIGGLLHLTAPFAYGSLEWIPILNSLAIGVALLVAAPFVGPMPRRLPPKE